MVWRGPMVTQALEQLVNETKWRDVDYLDRRPAAGHGRHPADARPARPGHRRGDRHDAAGHRAHRRAQGAQDVREGRHPDPRHRREHEHCTSAATAATKSASSATGGGERMGKDYDVELLGSLPLDIKIREQADSGMPTVVADPDGRDRRDLPADRAPRRGQDRREAAGPLRRVSRRSSSRTRQ